MFGMKSAGYLLKWIVIAAILTWFNQGPDLMARIWISALAAIPILLLVELEMAFLQGIRQVASRVAKLGRLFFPAKKSPV